MTSFHDTAALYLTFPLLLFSSLRQEFSGRTAPSRRCRRYPPSTFLRFLCSRHSALYRGCFTSCAQLPLSQPLPRSIPTSIERAENLARVFQTCMYNGPPPLPFTPPVASCNSLPPATSSVPTLQCSRCCTVYIQVVVLLLLFWSLPPGCGLLRRSSGMIVTACCAAVRKEGLTLVARSRCCCCRDAGDSTRTPGPLEKKTRMYDKSQGRMSVTMKNVGNG